MKLIKITAMLFVLSFFCTNSFAQKTKGRESPTYQGVYQKNNNKLHKRHHHRGYHKPGTSPYYKREN